MPYKLLLESTVPENVIRIVNGQIDQAVSELTDKNLDLLAAVHEARKRVKKIRAGAECGGSKEICRSGDRSMGGASGAVARDRSLAAVGVADEITEI